MLTQVAHDALVHELTDVFFFPRHAALLWSSHHHLLQCREAAMVNGQQRECAESGEGGEVSVWHRRLLDYVGACIYPSF